MTGYAEDRDGWHVITGSDDEGWWHAACGRRILGDADLHDRPGGDIRCGGCIAAVTA